MRALPHNELPSFKSGMDFHGYTISCHLGYGAFSHVYKAIHQESQKAVAIKVVNKQQNSLQQSDMLSAEIDILKKVDHPFITHLYEVIETEKYIAIVQELIDGMTLGKMLEMARAFTEKQIQVIASQIILTLEYLHNQLHITHRDIKEENIMIDNNFNIRVIDFGLSDFFDPIKPSLSAGVGTTPYLPPEIVNFDNYTQEVDVWSTGCLIYALAFGVLPFESNDKRSVYKRIKYMSPNFKNATLTENLTDLLTKMLEKDQNKRITIDELMKHPFLNSDDSITKEKISEFFIPQYHQCDVISKIHLVEQMHQVLNSKINYFNKGNFRTPSGNKKFLKLLDNNKELFVYENQAKAPANKNRKRKVFQASQSAASGLSLTKLPPLQKKSDNCFMVGSQKSQFVLNATFFK